MADRRDLLKTIDEQQQQLTRYQKKLRDVVAAYKSIVKEKEALEASLKVLSTSTSASNTTAEQMPTTSTPSKATVLENVSDTKTSSMSLVEQDHDKVTTLTRALATLSEERTRTEANHQADKKKLRLEVQQLEGNLDIERKEAINLRQHLTEKMTELRNKLRSQQVDREKDENNHAIMMRELQTVVAVERSEKEKLEIKLEDLQRQVMSDRRQSKVTDECDQYRRQVVELTDQLRSTRTRLTEAEEQASRPQPLLLELQREMNEVKCQNREAVLQERKRANEAEERLQNIARLSEERVAGLEARLSELSETVGSYDRARQHDQLAILRLKERVTQLDMENTALVSAAGHHHSSVISTSNLDAVVDNDDDLNLDVQGLLQKMIKLKGLFKLANMRSQNPVNLEDILKREGLFADVNHEICKQEFDALKEEFERYKCRAQSMLRNNRSIGGSTKDHLQTTEKESTTLKSQVTELRNKVRNLSVELEEVQSINKTQIQHMDEELVTVKMKYARQLTKQEVEFKTTVADLENQMQKQRQRTLALLNEKDTEIRALKVLSPEVKDPSDPLKIQNKMSANAELEVDVHHSNEIDVDYDLLSVNSHEQKDNDRLLLHYAQEMAKKEADVSALRKSKHQLESALRELQVKMTNHEECHGDEIESLREEIGRLQRNRAREMGANLEYLKNVVIRYMLSSNPSSRSHMLNAIATMLEFTSAELDSVRQTHASTWWPRPASSTQAPSNPTLMPLT